MEDLFLQVSMIIIKGLGAVLMFLVVRYLPRVFRSIEDRANIDIDEKTEAKIQRIVLDGVAWVEQEAAKSVKENSIGIDSRDKLNTAISKIGKDLVNAGEKVGRDKIKDMIEAALGAQKLSSANVAISKIADSPEG